MSYINNTTPEDLLREVGKRIFNTDSRDWSFLHRLSDLEEKVDMLMEHLEVEVKKEAPRPAKKYLARKDLNK